jgi:hypothetical protein
MSVMDFSATPLAAGSPLVPPPQRQLGKNPMLPEAPAMDDPQYAAQEAQLRATIGRQYADVLQQLGWVDEGGSFIPGSLSVNAGRQVGNLTRSSDLAAEQVTNEAQRQRTLFSGRRAVDTARAQYPYQSQIAQLGVDLPLALGGLYENAAGILDQYTLQNNLLLAALAARRSQAIAQQPAGAGAGGGGGGAGAGVSSGVPEEKGTPTAQPTPTPALAPTEPVIGYGGGANAAQVARNTVDYAEHIPGSEETLPPAPEAAPEAAPAPEDTGIWLAQIPSDHPLLADLMQLANTPPPGFGGGRNAAQVRRNML